MSKETLTKISAQRDHIYNLMQGRRALGGFDAHALVIIEIMQAQLDMMNHIISEAEATKKKHASDMQRMRDRLP